MDYDTDLFRAGGMAGRIWIIYWCREGGPLRFATVRYGGGHDRLGSRVRRDAGESESGSGDVCKMDQFLGAAGGHQMFRKLVSDVLVVEAGETVC